EGNQHVLQRKAVHDIGANADNHADHDKVLKLDRSERRPLLDAQQSPRKEHEHVDHHPEERQEEINRQSRKAAGAAFDLDIGKLDQRREGKPDRIIEQHRRQHGAGDKETRRKCRHGDDKAPHAAADILDKERETKRENAVKSGVGIEIEKRGRQETENNRRHHPFPVREIEGQDDKERHDHDADRQLVRRVKRGGDPGDAAGKDKQDKERRDEDHPPVLKTEALDDDPDDEAGEKEIGEFQKRRRSAKALKEWYEARGGNELVQQHAV